MGYARPFGQSVSVRRRNRANTLGVCGYVAFVQFGILGEDFRLCRHPIGRLVEIQLVAAGATISIDNAPRLNVLAIGSLVHASDFVRVALPFF
jgi:hypothetical protein